MFFKSLCRVLLTMVIRVSWTGPLPSCRFKGEATEFHPLQNLIAVLFSFCFFFSVLLTWVLISVANLSSRWVESASWSSSQLVELFHKPCSLYTMQMALLTGERFYDKHLRSSQSMGEQSEYNFFKEIIYVAVCWILAHIIIEVSKFGYFIFSSIIYWHGLIQTQIDYLNLWMQVDLNVKTILAYCYFLFTGIKYCVAVKEMYNSNPVWTSQLLYASIVQGLNNQCERIEETHRNV